MITVFTPRAIDLRRRREAAEWLVANEAADENIGGSEAEWQSWSDNRRNRAEYAAMIQVRQLMRAQPAPSAATDEELLCDTAEPPQTVTSPARAPGRRLSPWIARHRVTIASCAAALAAVSIAAFLYRSYPLAPGPRAQEFQTAVGEQRELRLGDGSLITLEGDSQVTIRFGTSREVDLLKGGATFDVMKERSHSFIVHTSSGSIVVVGTRFVVHQYSQFVQRVRVWVSEGAVEVVPSQPSAAAAGPPGTVEPRDSTHLLVKGGQEVSYTATDTSPPRPIDLATFPNRIPGMFMYRARPLAEVIEDLQRYSTQHISVDPNVAALEFSGSIFRDNVDRWLEGLPDIFPTLSVEHRGNQVLILGRFAPSLLVPQTALRQHSSKQ